jgi:asparagine synthase (glutamine-hydrolysing)
VSDLAPLELALGLLLGGERAPALPRTAVTPLAAFEAAVIDGLRAGPCLVSFSGGRDSSAVLAVATRIARREGLPDPIPATIRPREAPAADETRWQELVVGHLGLDDWLRIGIDDELDVVGPVSRGVMRRHGLLWPFNAHFHVPMLEAARGGTLLTGVGGDELFRGAARPDALAAFAGPGRPGPRALRRLALAVAPRRARAWWWSREPVDMPWLTPEGRTAATCALAADSAAEPLGLGARLRWLRGLRYLRVGTESLAKLAGDAGARIVHPLLDPALFGAVRRAAPRTGFADRATGLRAVCGALLPPELITREDKATFDEMFFREPSRELAERWDGAGAPAGIVDAEALRAHWLGPEPRAQTYLLLQAAWLASGADRVEEPGAGLGERVPAVGASQPEDRE